MGKPVTLDNYQQLADAQGKKLNEQIDHQLNEIRKNYQSWAEVFAKAEENRRADEKEWQNLYWKIHKEENAWWKKMVMFGLNAVQLWSLTQQYKQQKEIADRTYNLANRQLKLAEEMYNYYKEQFQPHEVKLGNQINNYFNNPYRQQYETTGGRFVTAARVQMVGKRREVLMCASQYCTGAVKASLKNLAVKEANLVANAMNSAVKYEDLREQRLTDKWLQTRLAFVQAGRGVANQGVTGIDGAVKAFSSFQADPGSALARLLGTVAYTVGGLIPAPTVPTTAQGQASSSGIVYNNRPQVQVQVNTEPTTYASY